MDRYKKLCITIKKFTIKNFFTFRPIHPNNASFKVQTSQQSLRFYADYPNHIKVSLPALSPTMETGTIVSWAKKEGK